MPWIPNDAHAYKKGLSWKEAAKWARIANAILKQTGDEVRAIKGANSRTVARKKAA